MRMGFGIALFVSDCLGRFCAVVSALGTLIKNRKKERPGFDGVRVTAMLLVGFGMG